MPDKKSYNADDAPPPRGLQSGPRSGVKDPTLGHQFSKPPGKWTSADMEAYLTRPGRPPGSTGWPHDLGPARDPRRYDRNLPVEKKKSVTRPRSMSKR